MIKEKPIRVLYSFPHKLGATRVSYAAWKHVCQLDDQNVELTIATGALRRPVENARGVYRTLSLGGMELPYRLFPKPFIMAIHDIRVASIVKRNPTKYDIVHTFPQASLKTLKTARDCGVVTVLERCNAHTKFAYRVVELECQKLGLRMPAGHEHEYNDRTLKRETAEFAASDYLLCPSEFVKATFVAEGFRPSSILRFQYGYDDAKCYLSDRPNTQEGGLKVLFAAGCAPRKGLHLLLEAWAKSSIRKSGELLIAGEFIPGYKDVINRYLDNPKIKLIGFQKDLGKVMRESDIFVLPSIEEGSALVTYDARACGCVLAVSDATGAVSRHEFDSLIHPAGDVNKLSEHLTLLHEDRSLLAKLRQNSILNIDEVTWKHGAGMIALAYREALKAKKPRAQKSSL